MQTTGIQPWDIRARMNEAMRPAQAKEIPLWDFMYQDTRREVYAWGFPHHGDVVCMPRMFLLLFIDLLTAEWREAHAWYRPE